MQRIAQLLLHIPEFERITAGGVGSVNRPYFDIEGINRFVNNPVLSVQRTRLVGGNGILEFVGRRERLVSNLRAEYHCSILVQHTERKSGIQGCQCLAVLIQLAGSYR
ncbi:hypothetical protein D3C75_640540 [compost metagenome]